MIHLKIHWNKRVEISHSQEPYYDYTWYRVPVDSDLIDKNKAWSIFLDLKKELGASYPVNYEFGEFQPGKSVEIAHTYAIGD